MLPEDENEFLDFIFQRPHVILLRKVSDTSEFNLGRTALIEPSKLRQVFICASCFDLDKNNIEKIYYTKYDENLGIYLETEKAYFTISHTSDASIIEFTRSFLNDDERLMEGRIWAEMYRVQEDKLVRKEPEFITWYDEIAHWLRKNFIRDKKLNAYLSHRVLKWQQGGGQLN